MHIGGIPSGSVVDPSVQPAYERDERPAQEAGLEFRDSARIAELQRQDSFIRKYAGSRSLATGAPATYQTILGPDGNRYVVSGSVDLQVTPTPGDPGATLREAGTIRRIVEVGPILSPADRTAAVEARRLEWEARRELANAETARRGLYTPAGRLIDTAFGGGSLILTG